MTATLIIWALVARTPVADGEQARQHHERGLIHYNLGEFEQAIGELKRAYELSAVPAVLFNLAQAYRLNGDHREALHAYRSFLRLRPESPNRRDVKRRIVQLEKLVGAAAQTPSPVPPVPTAQPVEKPDGDRTHSPPTAATPATQSVNGASGTKPVPSGGLTPLGLATAGLGVAFVGTGVFFSVRARDASEQLSALAADRGVWSSHYDDVYQSGETAERISIVAYVAGGVALVSGLLMVWLDTPDVVPDAAVAPVENGGAVTLRWRY